MTGIDMQRLPPLSRPTPAPTCSMVACGPAPRNRISARLVRHTCGYGRRRSSYSGDLLGQGLQRDAALEGIPLQVKKIYRAALGNVEAGQQDIETGPRRPADMPPGMVRRVYLIVFVRIIPAAIARTPPAGYLRDGEEVAGCLPGGLSAAWPPS